MIYCIYTQLEAAEYWWYSLSRAVWVNSPPSPVVNEDISARDTRRNPSAVDVLRALIGLRRKRKGPRGTRRTWVRAQCTVEDEP